MVPATGTFEPGHPWRGKPTFEIKIQARGAEVDAGGRFRSHQQAEGQDQTSASGSGQMQPLAMNEYLQLALAECYFDVGLDIIEWNTLFTNWRRGARTPPPTAPARPT